MSNTTINDYNINGNSDDDQNATLAVTGFVVILAIISIVLRLYVRISIKVGLGWDDSLLLAAIVLAIITAIVLLWGNSIDPNGTQISDSTDPSYVYTPEDVLYIKLSFVSSVLYFSIVGFTKLGILCMYSRIFSRDKIFRLQLRVVSFLVTAWWIGCNVACLTNCIPLEWIWLNALDNPLYCFNFNVFWMVSGICEVILDILILALPIRVTLSLQLSTQKRATVACIFLLGGFVIVTGLIKVILGYVPGSREPSYSRTEVWTAIHAGMAIICASLPTFRLLATRISESALATKVASSFFRPRSYDWGAWSRRSRSRNKRAGCMPTQDEPAGSETELRMIGSR